MRWALIVGAVLTLGVTPASAQTNHPQVSGDVQRVSRETLDYANNLRPEGDFALITQADHLFNALPQEVRASVDAARVAFDAERTRIQAMPAPRISAPGIDLSFALESLRATSLRRLGDMDRALTALDGMANAQASGDCTAFASRGAELASAQLALRPADLWNDTRRLEEFLGIFDGVAYPPSPAPGSRDPTADNARNMNRLADALAKQFRCPLTNPTLTFELEAHVQENGVITARVTSISDQSQRSTIEQRLAGAALVPAYLINRSPLIGQALRFTWTNQRLTPSAR